jgi:hypothetical protein
MEKVSVSKRVLSVVAIVASCGVFLGSASATTTPGALNHIRMTITNAAIQIPLDQFDKAGGPVRYPRGTKVEYTIINKGSKPVELHIAALAHLTYVIGSKTLSPKASAGKPIAPGATRHWTLSFLIRGNYQLYTVIQGKVVAKKSLVVF